MFVFTDMSHNSTDPFSEPTEYEYLKKVMFEYMMGRETKVHFGGHCDDVIWGKTNIFFLNINFNTT